MSKQRRILIIGNFLSKATGSRGVCEDLADGMAGLGWNIFISSDKPKRLIRLFDMLFCTIRWREKYDVAVVDVFSGNAFLWAEMVAFILRLLRKPYILSLHGGDLPRFSVHWPKRVRFLLSSATIVTAPSGFLQEQMKSYRSDIALIPNPIDLSRYIFSPRDTVRPILVWLRAFHKIYNPSMAVKVIASLIDDYPDVNLIMCGGDTQDGSFTIASDLAESLGISRAVQFIGRIPKIQVPHWLQKADIFLNTTNIDNTPVSVVEAMACGLCVVSTDVGGLSYLLDNELDSVLVPVNNAKAMEMAVRRLLTDAGFASRLSVSARRKAEQYDLRVVLLKWDALLQYIYENKVTNSRESEK